MKKIDIHVHTRKVHGVPSLAGNVFPTYDELRLMYDKLGIEKGVNLPMMSLMSWHLCILKPIIGFVVWIPVLEAIPPRLTYHIT